MLPCYSVTLLLCYSVALWLGCCCCCCCSDTLLPCYSATLLPCCPAILLPCSLLLSLLLVLLLVPCCPVTLLPCCPVTMLLCYPVARLACVGIAGKQPVAVPAAAVFAVAVVAGGSGSSCSIGGAGFPSLPGDQALLHVMLCIAGSHAACAPHAKAAPAHTPACRQRNAPDMPCLAFIVSDLHRRRRPWGSHWHSVMGLVVQPGQGIIFGRLPCMSASLAVTCAFLNATES